MIIIFTVLVFVLQIRPPAYRPDNNILEVTDFDEIGDGFGLGKIVDQDLGYLYDDIKLFGSFMDTNESTGTMATRWYRAESHSKVTIAVVGTPYRVNRYWDEGNALFVEIRDAEGTIKKINYEIYGYLIEPILWNFLLDKNAREFRIVAIDESTGWGGWLGFSEPIKNNPVLSLVPIFAIPGSFIYIIIFIAPGYLIARQFTLKKIIDKKYLLILSITLSSLLAYLIFWVYYFSSAEGKMISVVLVTVSVIIIIINFKHFKEEILDINFISPLVLLFFAGCMYLGLSYLYTDIHSNYYHIFNSRFYNFTPGGDHIIPKILLDRIYYSVPLTNFLGDWLASDRLPLSTAILIILYPFSIFKDSSLFYQFVGTYIQMFWIPALYSLCLFFNFNKYVSNFIIGNSLLSGFFIVNSTYIWPKLLTTLFFTLLFILVFEISNEKQIKFKLVMHSKIIGICAALSILSHGGIAFSLIAFGLSIMISKKRMNYKYIFFVFVSFFVVYFPWFLFQKLVDPPGNRLTKWHLAGMVEINDYSLWDALFYAYSSTPIIEIVTNKVMNILNLFAINPGEYSSIAALKSTIFAKTFGTALILNLFILVLIPHFIINYLYKKKLVSYKNKVMFCFFILSFTIWPLLMFDANNTYINHGSYFNILLIYIFIAYGVKYSNRIFSNLIYMFNIIIFILLWVPSSEVSFFRFLFFINPGMLIIMILSAILFFMYIYRGTVYER